MTPVFPVCNDMHICICTYIHIYICMYHTTCERVCVLVCMYTTIYVYYMCTIYVCTQLHKRTAYGIWSANLILRSQSNMSLFNDTWQMRRKELSNPLSLEIRQMTTPQRGWQLSKQGKKQQVFLFLFGTQSKARAGWPRRALY